jgi:signal transduction histidine kinase
MAIIYPFFPIVVCLLLGLRWSIIYTAVVMSCIVFGYLTQTQGWLTWLVMKHSDINPSATFVLLAFLTLFGVYVGRIYYQSRKAAEQSAAEKSQIESIAMLSGDLAHQINTPLAVIRMNAESTYRRLTKEKEQDARQTKTFEATIRAVDQIKTIIKTLAAFGKQSENSTNSLAGIDVALKRSLSIFHLQHMDSSVINYTNSNPELFVTHAENKVAFAFLALLDSCYRVLNP